MFKNSLLRYALPGAAAGFIAGLFGSGGGMILIPLLYLTARPSEEEVFPTCLVAIIMDAVTGGSLPLGTAWPYMLGGGIGGVLAGLWAKKIPTLWLHRGLGLLIIWGGVRYLC